MPPIVRLRSMRVALHVRVRRLGARARVRRFGVGVEAFTRDTLARKLLERDRPEAGLGDRLTAIWEGADCDGLSVKRDDDPHEPPSFV